MKGLICYYSGTGNTLLVTKYLAKKITNVEFELFDITENKKPNIDKYDIVGFATFADSWGTPFLMENFIKSLNGQNKPAFVFNTYGCINGRTLRVLRNLVKANGFNFVAGHALHTPENFPQMIKSGFTFENAPNPKKRSKFEAFIIKFDSHLSDYLNGKKLKKIPINFGSIFSPAFSRKKSKKSFGDLLLDEEKCNGCGKCQKKCPYSAISLNPKPVFNNHKCYGCTACFHHCKEKAIYTTKFKDIGHYSGPGKIFRDKFQV